MSQIRRDEENKSEKGEKESYNDRERKKKVPSNAL